MRSKTKIFNLILTSIGLLAFIWILLIGTKFFNSSLSEKTELNSYYRALSFWKEFVQNEKNIFRLEEASLKKIRENLKNIDRDLVFKIGPVVNSRRKLVFYWSINKDRNAIIEPWPVMLSLSGEQLNLDRWNIGTGYKSPLSDKSWAHRIYFNDNEFVMDKEVQFSLMGNGKKIDINVYYKKPIVFPGKNNLGIDSVYLKNNLGEYYFINLLGQVTQKGKFDADCPKNKLDSLFNEFSKMAQAKNLGTDSEVVEVFDNIPIYKSTAEERKQYIPTAIVDKLEEIKVTQR